MENAVKSKEAKFSDYIYVIYKWKKFIFINLLVIGIITTGLVFLIPNDYKATATIMIPPDNQNNLGGLSSLLGGKSSIASMGSKLFGVANTSEDVLLGILNSRTALKEIVNRFGLFKYYEINEKNYDKVLKVFRSDFSVGPNEFGMIDISVVNKDPKLSADISNFMVRMVDSLNILYNVQRAQSNRLFLEKRYFKNIEDLRNAEDSLYKFQKKYGIVAVPEQLEVTIKAAAEIESQLTKKEIESFFIKQQFGENTPQYLGSQQEVELLKAKVQELKNSNNLSSKSNILFSFKEMPDIAIKYMRIYREVQIQQSILEFVMPMYEQAKVEEQKSIPTVMIIDNAVPPQLKYSPKRSFFILGILFLTTFLLIPFVFICDTAINKIDHENPLQLKFKKLVTRIHKLYRLKF